MKLTVRPMIPRATSWTPASGPDDRSFVVESWIASWRHRPSIISVGDWHGVMVLAIDRILASGVKVAMAVDLDAEPGVADLRGWLAYETRAVDRSYNSQTRSFEYRRAPADMRDRSMDPLVWYCFVKAPYRQHGIARRLFDAAGIDPRGRFHYITDTPSATALLAAGKLRAAACRPLLGQPPNERGPHATRREADHAA